MSITVRKYFYEEATVDGNKELDYLTSTLLDIDLRTQEFYTVDATTENRPDLISLMYYGNYDLGWLLCVHNKFQDPLTDFYVGRRVAIPSLTEYYQYYNRNTRKP